MKVSFIIPAYNEEAYIGACLETLKAEIARNGSAFETEIIVVDNASNDLTKTVAESYPGVKVVYEGKKSSSSARQKGFSVSSGEILAFLDADVRIRDGWLPTLLAAFDDPDTVAISGPYLYYDMPPVWKELALPYAVVVGKIAHLATGHCVAGGNMAIRRSALEDIGGFDTSVVQYGDDLDVARRLQKVGKIIYSEKLVIETSARRFNSLGVLETTGTYAMNFLSVALLKHPIKDEFLDIR